MRYVLPLLVGASVLGCNALIGLESSDGDSPDATSATTNAVSTTIGSGVGSVGSVGSVGATSGSAASGGSGSGGATSGTATSVSAASGGAGSGGACGAGFTCVAVESAWNGPFGIADASGCPSEWTPYLSGGHGVDESAITCGACSCADADVACHATASVYLGAGCGAALTSFEVSAFDCASNPIPSVPGGGSLQLSQSEVDVGTCAPSGGARGGAAALTQIATLCTPPSISGGCASGEVCLASPPDSLRPARCVEKPGDVDCPVDYPSKEILYADLDDGVTCSACGCGAPAGADCAFEIGFYGDALCAAATETVSYGVCGAIVTGGYARGPRVTGAASCTPSGGDMVGAVTPSTSLTVCCANGP